MIAIVDYGAGNLRSVVLAFARIGVKAKPTSDGEEISASDGVVLPGVGAFSDAMGALKSSGLIAPLLDFASSGRPLLGICLGMQMLLDGSEEGTWTDGLGLIPGKVRMLPAPGLKIPHMGWNSLTITKKFALFENVPDKSYVYFVHSFACRADNPEHVLAVTEYGVPFHSAVGRDNITGLQFHPEKSYLAGQTILKNFAAMAGL